MCGFFAVFQRAAPIPEGAAEAAIARLTHRGPDHQAVRHFSAMIEGADPFELHGALAHSRLAILDLDPRANQPFGRPDAGGLVYNGEIYNYRELRQARPDRGAFTTDCDTELLYCDLLSEQGPDFAAYNGMWSYAFWDAASQCVRLGRDRYGQKPLHYYLDEDRFIVASEVRPILNYLGRSARLDDAMVAAFLRHGTAFPMSGGGIIAEPVRQLPPSHVARFDPASWTLSTERYFRPAMTVRNAEPQSLEEAFRNAVLSRLVSDRPVGLLLSGGIDSTLILSVLASEGRLDQVRCFIGDTGTSEDAAYARKCAQQLGLHATDIRLDYTEDAFGRFLAICAHMEKPFPMLGNSMALPEMYHAVSQTDVRVVLDGTGGDEVFGGYWDRYMPAFAAHAEQRGHVRWHRRTAEGDHLPQTVAALDARLRGEDPAFARRAGPYLKPQVAAAEIRDPLAHDRQPPRKTLLTDAFRGRLTDWLWQNDRNAMMFGLENRSPFLDIGLVPFIGTDYRNKFRGDWNKLELRQLFDAFTPLPTQWRQQKQGFRWQAGEFVDGNRDRLLELIAGSRIVPEFIERDRYLDDSRAGKMPPYGLTTRLACIAALEQSLPATV